MVKICFDEIVVDVVVELQKFLTEIGVGVEIEAGDQLARDCLRPRQGVVRRFKVPLPQLLRGMLRVPNQGVVEHHDQRFRRCSDNLGS